MIKSCAFAFFLCLSAISAKAQETFWVQIAARATLTEAQELVRDYARQLDGIHGFYLGTGFYGIVIGPFDRTRADATLARLLRNNQVPADSFVNDGRRFQQQFWPIGGGITPPRGTVSVTPQTADEATAVFAPTNLPDETLREARNSESLLGRSAREELQIALRWAGFYNAAIDGAFGRGTRAAMERWQRANNEEPTGVLTTRQRAALLAAYNAVLTEAQMRTVEDADAGIAMQLPTALVAFSEYEPPFVKFEANADLPQVQVLFISQKGDAERLRGLYEVMQILDIVPPEGPRAISGDGFEIEGISDRIHSYTTATLRDGEIKGFTLVWPAGDEQRRSRILTAMQDSFTRLRGTLDPEIVPASAEQSIDLVAGLSVRQPQVTRSGFYVTTEGLTLTTSDAVESCERITIDRDIDVSVVANDTSRGIALLAPVTPQSPIATGAFNTNVPRLRTRVAVAGFPFDGALPEPTLTYGEIADIRSLDGDERILRLAMTAQAGDAGGPILDEKGAVMGMLLAKPETGSQVLPENVNFAIKSSDIAEFVSRTESSLRRDQTIEPLTPVALARQAADLTVLVSCW